MLHVVVQGLMGDEGREILPESAGGPETGPAWAIAVTNLVADPPPPGSRVQLTGVLTGRDLRVESWVPVQDPYPWASEYQSDAGVSSEELDHIMEDVPRDWDVISIGASKTHSGKRIGFLEVFLATREMVEWIARQTPDSVKIHPFARELWMEPVLVSGQSAPPTSRSSP